jgi:hypothetical protein
VNILPQRAPLRVWKAFWQSVGGGEDVVFAEDTGQRAVAAFNVRALGTTIIVNREGRVVYRDSAPPYETLRSEVDKAL